MNQYNRKGPSEEHKRKREKSAESIHGGVPSQRGKFAWRALWRRKMAISWSKIRRSFKESQVVVLLCREAKKRERERWINLLHLCDRVPTVCKSLQTTLKGQRQTPLTRPRNMLSTLWFVFCMRIVCFGVCLFVLVQQLNLSVCLPACSGLVWLGSCLQAAVAFQVNGAAKGLVRACTTLAPRDFALVLLVVQDKPELTCALSHVLPCKWQSRQLDQQVLASHHASLSMNSMLEVRPTLQTTLFALITFARSGPWLTNLMSCPQNSN